MVIIDKIQADFENIVKSDNSDSYIGELRQKGLESFRKSGIPTLKNEEWKYTDVRKFLDESFQFNVVEEIANLKLADVLPTKYHGIDAWYVVMVNGVLNQHLTNFPGQKGVQLLSLKDAFTNEGFSALLKKRFNSLNDNDTEAFSALNNAFLANGLFLHVEKNVKLEKPLFVIQYGDVKTQNTVLHPRNFFNLETSASAELIWFYHTGESSKEVFFNEVTEAFIADNAELKIDRINRGYKNLKLVSSGHYKQGRDSRLNVFNFNNGGNLARNNYEVSLDGQNAYTSLSGLFFAHGDAHLDNHILINHNKPNCISDQLFKGVLKDNGQGVFNGKIYVKRDAQKTAAFQSNKNLLLSDNAGVYTKPQLEIYADDVKCSHGATTGQIDKNAFFYLRSRGLDKVMARSILTLAFAGEVIRTANQKALVELLEAEVEEVLKF